MEASCRVVWFVAGRDDSVLVDTIGALPETTLAGDPTTRAIQAAADRLIGPGHPLLRATTIDVDPERDHAPTILAAEGGPLDLRAPDGCTWTPPAAVRLAKVPARVADAFDWWLDRRTGHRSPLEPSFSAPGWFERAAAWTADRMAGLDIPATGPTELHYLWPLAAILVTPSSRGRVFLKCPSPAFPNEWRYSEVLAGRSPGAVPTVLAVEPAEGWFLMDDFGDRILGRGAHDAWPAGMARFAEIQLAWFDDLEPLRMAGARPRPLELLADTAASLADEDWVARLPEAERARVQAAAPRLVDACHRLAGLGLPDTLIHGDLHPWNIAVTDGGLVVFDWTDAGIGHPFLDLPVFLSETPDPGQRLAIREAVVTAWSGGWERAAVEEAADLALAIGSLNQADVYRLLLGLVEPWDHLWLHDADLRWLRAALSALDHGIDMRAD